MDVKYRTCRTRRSIHIGSVGLLLLCLLFVSSKDAVSSQVDEVHSATARFANYLVHNSKQDGMFQYRINMNPAIEAKAGYNILRHAGTVYAMSMYYKLKPDPNMQAAIKRTGSYLRDKAINPGSRT